MFTTMIDEALSGWDWLFDLPQAAEVEFIRI
jgi:hypothetical protein